MKALLALIPLPYKLLGAGLLVAALFGAWEWHNYTQRQIGAADAEKKIEKETNDAIKNLSDDAENVDLDYRACIDGGLQWNWEKNRCGGN